jgi:peptidyl-prolyl cis-trans isomerase A (cyclophilin A)
MHTIRVPVIALAAILGLGVISSAAAEETFRVKFETSAGHFVVEVHPDWAPKGAARFKELVEAKYYDECRFFRVIEGFMAQFGMNGDPEVNAKWDAKEIQDDPVKQSNTRGRMTFATSGPNTRTTQLFINFGNNKGLDSQGFSPFAEVVEGMEVVDKLYNGYGEGAPQGNGPSQGRIAREGNKYLNDKFPKLDYIKTARIEAAKTK